MNTKTSTSSTSSQSDWYPIGIKVKITGSESRYKKQIIGIEGLIQDVNMVVNKACFLINGNWYSAAHNTFQVVKE